MACKIIAAALLACAASAHAGPPLEARDLNQDGIADAYYDAAQNLSFAADADLTTTLGFFDWPGASGLYRASALLWPATLDLYGVTGWRAPRPISVACMSDDEGFLVFCEVDRSELSELPTLDVFRNVLPAYWLDGELPVTGAGGSRVLEYFRTDDHHHGETDESLSTAGVWPVHDGDVGTAISAVTQVPEPGTWALLLAGIVGTLTARCPTQTGTARYRWRRTHKRRCPA